MKSRFELWIEKYCFIICHHLTRYLETQSYLDAQRDTE